MELSQSNLFLPIAGVVLLVIVAIVFFLLKGRKGETRKCPQCGMELESFMEYCIYCGDGAESTENTDIASMAQISPAARKTEDIPQELVDTSVLVDEEREIEETTTASIASQEKRQNVIDDLSELLLDDSSEDEKILKQLQRTTILTRVPSLDIIKGKKRTKSVRLNKELFYFGKELGCDVILENEPVENRHAVIKNDGRNMIIFALSENKPIEVNGKGIKKHELQEGDVIRIGQYSFVYRVDEQN